MEQNLYASLIPWIEEVIDESLHCHAWYSGDRIKVSNPSNDDIQLHVFIKDDTLECVVINIEQMYEYERHHVIASSQYRLPDPKCLDYLREDIISYAHTGSIPARI